jgi:hypothetical protein
MIPTRYEYLKEIPETTCFLGSASVTVPLGQILAELADAEEQLRLARQDAVAANFSLGTHQERNRL